MAGSYKHVVTKTGKLRKPKDVLSMLETSSGDVYEAVEEMYGMIWYLAEQAAEVTPTGDPAVEVERARQNYRVGLERSPGVKA